jgi:hypothetical protein
MLSKQKQNRNLRRRQGRVDIHVNQLMRLRNFPMSETLTVDKGADSLCPLFRDQDFTHQ